MYLGVIIDNKLDVNLHTQLLVEQFDQFCGVTYVARHFSRRQMLWFYESYVKTRLLYVVLICGGTSETHLTEIYKALKRIARATYFERRN